MEASSVTDTTQHAEQQADMPSLPPPPPPIAPGTARISASIIHAEETERGYHCTLKVEDVHGYGSSTPPLPTGSEIKALMLPHVIDSMEPSISMETLMGPDKTVNLTLKHNTMAKMLGDASPNWQVSSINP